MMANQRGFFRERDHHHQRQDVGQPRNQLGPNLLYVLVALILLVGLQALYVEQQATADISYSEFRQLLEDGAIESVTVGEDYLAGTLAEPRPDGRQEVRTVRVGDSIYEDLQQYDVEVRGETSNDFLNTLFLWLIPIFIFVAIWYFLFRRLLNQQMGGGMFSQVGKSRANLHREGSTGVAFKDVAGVDEAKQDLMEVVDFLVNPDRYHSLGARIPKGLLLVGPPGTGKTLMAKAVAGEADVPFFSISGSEFVEMFVGVGAKRVRELFEQARKEAPCIVFIDELDALGRARQGGGGLGGGGHDEKEQTLNQLLAEMDGFDPSENIVVLAATNRPEVLDQALQRAGRFDRQVIVDRPDLDGRRQILNVYLPRIRADSDVDPARLAGMTAGFAGADLANLVNEAALFASRRKARRVAMQDFEDALERLVAGQEKRTRRLNAREREIVAYHEMGHAVVALSLTGVDPVQKVSIIPRTVGALGYTIQRPTEDRFLMTRTELENRILVLLGGRVAEWLVFGHLSTGAADDLQKATEIARNMVTRYGMVEELGHVALERDQNRHMATLGMPARDYAEATAERIDDAVKALTDEAFVRTERLLRQRYAVLDTGARTLLETETLSEGKLRELMGEHGFAVHAPRRQRETDTPDHGGAQHGDDPQSGGHESLSEAAARRRYRRASVPPAGKSAPTQRRSEPDDGEGGAQPVSPADGEDPDAAARQGSESA